MAKPFGAGWSAIPNEAFTALLDQFHPDRDRAWEVYATYRTQLLNYFARLGCSNAEDLADESILRAARAIVEGSEVYSRVPYSFLKGIAGNVYKENQRSGVTDQMDDNLDHPQLQSRNATRDQYLDCLDTCLEELPDDSKTLILEYYGVQSGRLGNQDREKIAQTVGLTLNHLRVKVHRLQNRLEACIENCLKNEE
ncbi:MAG: hypothetical protein HY774_16385 [Acidobacteria bacterium]|nr:hypothetical protein [Acidobacteriota bacterium]